MHPTRLEIRDANRLAVEWSDGVKQEIAIGLLRSSCPCATCHEKRNQPEPPKKGLQVITLAEARPMAIESMRPVGNYAYAIGFSDGHDTGIFTLEFLRSLGTAVEK